MVMNDQQEAVPAFGVLAVTETLYDQQGLSNQAAMGLSEWVRVKSGAPTGEENEILCVVQRAAQPTHLQPAIVMGPTLAWVYVNDTGHCYAKAIPDNVQMLDSAESGPVRLMCSVTKTGLQLLPVLLGYPAGEPTVNAKELFPAIVYKKSVVEKSDDGTECEKIETYILCPGGKGTEKSVKTVHVLHIEAKKVTTNTFGSLPTAMNNFAAALADNGYGGKMLVCTPGDVDDGSRFPVQRFEFETEQWSKSDTSQSLAGCPCYEKDGKVIVAGGQSAYFVSKPVKTANSTVTQFYGHNTTPFWSVDPLAGTLETRTPMRLILSGSSEMPESNAANQQKRFLKQNFSGIVLIRQDAEKPLEFLAVGGSELLGYQAKAVVSYAMNSTGPVLDCENATINIGGECEVFPDTPLPLGECGAVRITKRKSGEMEVECDLLLCLGGRYRDENGKFVYHQKPWSLNLEAPTEGWRDDLFPEMPTPRIHAGVSEVVHTVEEVPVTKKVTHDDGSVTEEPVTDPETGKPVTETKEFDRVFVIGGRTEKGLTASIEALNLTTGEWETDWPGLDGRKPKKESMK